MECFFQKDKICPVPNNMYNPVHCVACATWATVEASRQGAQATKDMAKIMKEQTQYATEGVKSKEDSRKDVA